MVFIPEATIDQLIQDDVPYFDLTTQGLGIGDRPGRISFQSRDRLVLSGTQTGARMLQRAGATVTEMFPNAKEVESGVTFLAAEGKAATLHLAWKAVQNVLEYACGVATKTAQLVRLARETNPQAMLYTTRKHIPGTKPLAVQAILAGGAYPHRLGLSETILVFEQHLNFLGGIEGLISQLPQLQRQVKEKKIIVEVKEISAALELATAGVDGIQFDKVPAQTLAEAIATLKSINPNLVTLAAGGIHADNIQAYAAIALDGLVLTAPYFAPPADIKVQIEPIVPLPSNNPDVKFA
ncbi:ModD protein [Phormidium sp. CCY1219]|uniref:ModD protein n=1 Tax=Phormidium sp. CCY1219 TaxID=2886104 RepID=UPI002D1F2F93|nr:ModD protein [Phormidium sp. CCY1219]MEB3827193.1 ModD protein [Phormidium sp. CCY1219]